MPTVGESPSRTVASRLTDREVMIVYLMSGGHTVPEIAKLLGLSPRTVENHKRHIYEKLDVGSQSHAVAKAIWLGLLQPGRPHIPPLRGSGRQQWAGEHGRAILAVLLGPAGQGRDEVAQLLLSERVPFVVVVKREELINDHWLWWQRGPIVVVLVDPEPEDWSPTISLGAPIVVVRSCDVPEQLAVVDALARKASGLVSKTDVAVGISPILSAVAQGLLVMSWGYTETLSKWAPASSLTAPQLTAREGDILGSIACGHTIRQTARTLGIASKTVENTQARLFRKLDARNRMEALTIADALGLIEWTGLPVGKILQPGQLPGRPCGSGHD
jgi:two-component system, NarL family, nitrate/nitrite response regulator NarL